jgi:hypothetical protein
MSQLTQIKGPVANRRAVVINAVLGRDPFSLSKRCSMEIVRSHVDIAQRKYMHGCGSNIDNAVLILKSSFDIEDSCTSSTSGVPAARHIRAKVDS